MLLAPGEQRRALDIFHYQIGLAEGGGSAIEEARDAGMFELREDLTLSAETLIQIRITPGAGDQFNGDALVIFAVGAVGEIDDAHAAASDLFKDGIGADLLGRLFGPVGPKSRAR